MVLCLLCVFFSLVSIFFYINSTHSAQLAQPFQFDDPYAIYKIEKRDNGRNYVVAVYYAKSLLPVTYSYIESSPVSLDDYLGKEVQIDGDWPRYIGDLQRNVEIQCIQGVCHTFFPNTKTKITPSNLITIKHLEIKRGK